MILAQGVGVWLENLAQLMSVLAIFVLVLLATWLTTRWIAGYQRGQTHNQNLRVIETLKLTVNNYIQIIEVGDVYLVIAVSKDHVEKLAEITREQLKTASAEISGQPMGMGDSFRDILDKVKHHLPKK